MTADLSQIVKAYDVRGIVPDQWDASLAELFGAAFVQVTQASAIVVGHDMRPSSPGLSQAFARGAAALGADVTEIGLCSTDQLYFASGDLGLPGAMFTASHNPAQYNGIKMCRAGAAPVGQSTGLDEIRSLVEAWSEKGAPSPAPSPARSPAARPSATTPPTSSPWSTSPRSAPSRWSWTRATAWAATPCPPSWPGSRSP